MAYIKILKLILNCSQASTHLWDNSWHNFGQIWLILWDLQVHSLAFFSAHNMASIFISPLSLQIPCHILIHDDSGIDIFFRLQVGITDCRMTSKHRPLRWRWRHAYFVLLYVSVQISARILLLLIVKTDTGVSWPISSLSRPSTSLVSLVTNLWSGR